jgi:hypothetical protein
MSTSTDSIAVNPFEDTIVREPRDVSFSVKGLNEKPLNALLQEFSRLETSSPHRPIKAPRPQLVVSPDTGYGKSHLLGRLFSELRSRAIRVYVRPFQDPQKAWQSILLMTVQELERPAEPAIFGAQNQLKALARAILVRVAADLIAAHGIPGSQESPDQVIARLTRGEVPEAEAIRWIGWLMQQISNSHCSARVMSDIRGRGIDLLGREIAWLKVLATYMLDEAHGARAQAAAKWLRAEPLELPEIRALGIAEADSEGRGDCSPHEVDALSFSRLRAMCLLASYYRPFLFCFDETDFYVGDSALIGALGKCIERLYADLPNQLTVITTNHWHWLNHFSRLMEKPHLERLSPPRQLEGINETDARELITARLDQYGLQQLIKPFFADRWLEELFSTMPQEGVRNVLRLAAARFEQFEGRVTSPPSMDELFQFEVNTVRSKPALKRYNQDALMWFVKEIGTGRDDVFIERPGGMYFSYAWRWSHRMVAFAFEGGSHWRRWQAIAKEAVRMSEQNPQRASLFYVFRSPDLDVVPRDSWKEARSILDTACEHGFQIRVLKIDDVCEIHAGYELYSDALQGNIGYSAEDTCKWLQTHFAPFLNELAYRRLPEKHEHADSEEADTLVSSRPVEARLDQPAELDQESLGIVSDLVNERRIVDIQAALQKLGNDGLRDALLRSVEKHPNLQARPGPRTIYLQWCNTP